MLKEDLTKKSSGKLVKNPEGNLAFIPNPLPPNIEWNEPVVAAIAKANQTLGQLVGLGRNLNNPQRLVRMFLRREAELSSQIENAFARVQTMLLFENTPAIEKENPSVREVHNNFLAIEFVLRSVIDRGVTRSLIKEMHQILLREVRGSDRMPGRFRTMQAHIGRDGDIRNARFVPCPPHEVEQCMLDLELFHNQRDDCPALARVAIAHYQFEAIHPFADGNGRVGRALLLAQLVRECGLPNALLNPSAQLELNRREYYDRLLSVSQKGKWAEWIRFFADCIAAEAVDAVARIEKLEALRREYYDRVRKTRRASALALKMIDELLSDPSTTVAETSRILCITRAGSSALLGRLLDAGIIEEVTGRRRDRLFMATGIVELFAVGRT